ncbi:MAG: hypothetical protein KAG26_01125 [Methylococcales bacterium]|nr:hypothetical protein [Methylococcales bacterium]
MHYILFVLLFISTVLSAEPSDEMRFDTTKQACTQLSESLASNIGVEFFCKLEPQLSDKIQFMYDKVCHQMLTEAEIKQSSEVVMLELTEVHETLGEVKFCKQFVPEYDILLGIASQPAEKK